jgi:hypothetical protein
MSDRILDRYLLFRPQSIEFRQRGHVDSGLSGTPTAPYGNPR